MTWLLLGRRSAPLWLRLGLPISLIIALAIGFISFLNYYNYRKTYQQLNVARIMVVARDLRQAIESGLNVGLAPRSNTQLASSLTIAKDHTDGVRFAVVIDEAAKRLVGVGDAAANQDWQRRLQRAGEELSWLGEDDDTYQVGLPYRNSFGVSVGAVVLGYDKVAIDRATAAMAFTLFVDWIGAVLLLTTLTLLGTWRLTRELESELTQAEDALAHALSDKPMGDLRLPVLGEEIARGIPEFIERSRAAAAALGGSIPKPAQ
jgi:sensor histidine kinase regulating citrate/malate metabolism